jgi:hypothetical protein
MVAWLVDEADRRRVPRTAGTAITILFAFACTAGAIWAAGRWVDPVLG